VARSGTSYLGSKALGADTRSERSRIENRYETHERVCRGDGQPRHPIRLITEATEGGSLDTRGGPPDDRRRRAAGPILSSSYDSTRLNAPSKSRLSRPTVD